MQTTIKNINMLSFVLIASLMVISLGVTMSTVTMSPIMLATTSLPILILCIWVLRKKNMLLMGLAWLAATSPEPIAVIAPIPPPRRVRFRKRKQKLRVVNETTDARNDMITGYWREFVRPGETPDECQARKMAHYENEISPDGTRSQRTREEIFLAQMDPVRYITMCEWTQHFWYPHYSMTECLMEPYRSHSKAYARRQVYRDLHMYARDGEVQAEAATEFGVVDTINSWVGKYVVTDVASASATALSIATAGLAISSAVKHRSSLAICTAISAMTTMAVNVCIFLGITGEKLNGIEDSVRELLLAEAVQAQAWYDNAEEFADASKSVLSHPITSTLSLIVSAISAIIVAITTSKSPAEVIGRVPAVFRHSFNGVRDFRSALKELITELSPDSRTKEVLTNLSRQVARFEEIVLMEVNEFILPEIQEEARVIRDAITTLNTPEHSKNVAFVEFFRQHGLNVQRFLTRSTELAGLISQFERVRQIPVLLNITGKFGQGKSTLIRRLYTEMNRRLIEGGHRRQDMKIYNMTNGGDTHVPPPGNAEWYALDEYLANPDTDKWVSMMNNIVSDDPVSISSAFSKFNHVKAEVVVTTSNLREGTPERGGEPTTPGNVIISRTSPNFMNPEAMMAFKSRSNWIVVENPFHNPQLHRDQQVFPPTGPRLRRWIHTTNAAGTVSNWRYETMTEAQLLDWMVEKWIENRAKYVDARNALIAAGKNVAPMGEHAEAQALLDQRNPAVVYVCGAPGVGKTSRVLTALRAEFPNHTNVYIDKKFDLPKDVKNHNIIFDDVFELSDYDAPGNPIKAQLENYRLWFDKLHHSNNIFILNNFVPPQRIHFGGFFGIIGLLKMFWRVLSTRSLVNLTHFWRTSIVRIPDLSIFPREATLRRLGFAGTSFYRNKVLYGGLSRAIAVEVSSSGIKDLGNSSTDHMTIDEFIDRVAPLCRDDTPDLKKVTAIPEEGADFDLDIVVETPEHIMSAIGSDDPLNHVKFSASLFTSFPDYHNLMRNLDINNYDSIYEILNMAYKRHAYSCRVKLGTRKIVVLDGEVSGFPLPEAESGELILADEDRLVFRTDDGTNLVVTFEEIFCGTVNLDMLVRTTRRKIGLKISDYKASPTYKRWARNYAIKYHSTAATAAIIKSWAATKAFISQPKVKFLLGVTVALIGTAGVIWMGTVLADKIRSGGEENVTSESWREEKAQKKPVRVSTPTSTTTAPSASEKVTEAIKKNAPTLSPDHVMKKYAEVAKGRQIAAKSESLPESWKVHTLPDNVQTVRTAVDANMVCVRGGTGLRVHGIGIRDRYVITTAHVIPTVDSPIAVEWQYNGKSYSSPATMVFLDRPRELLLIEIQDKKTPLFKNITKHFLQQKHLHNLGPLIHFLPGDNTSYRCEAAYVGDMASPILDEKTPHFKPYKKIMTVNRFETSSPTSLGSCGTAFLSLNKKHECALIAGLHIAATTGLSMRSYASTITQQDIEYMLEKREVVTAEASSTAITTTVVKLDSAPEIILPSFIPLKLDQIEQPAGENYETDRFSTIGYVKTLYKPVKENVDFVPTIISQHLDPQIFPNDQIPSIKSFMNPLLTEEKCATFPLTHNQKPSLVLEQLRHIAGDYTSLSPHIHDILVENFHFMVANQEGIDRWRTLTDNETLNGIEDEYYRAGLGPMRTDASPGLPWTRKGHTTKASLLTFIEGQEDRIHFSPTEDGQLLREAFQLTIDSWAEGRQVMRLVDASLKAECLPREKALKPGTRVFAADAMETFLAQRKVLGYINAIAMLGRFTPYNHHTTGLNPYQEFWRIYEGLKKVGNYGFDLDYSKFDKRIPSWTWDVLITVFVRIAKDSDMRKQHKAKEIENLVTQALVSFRDKFYVSEGTLYYASGDMASGVFATNVMDSYLNDILVLSAIAVMASENKLAVLRGKYFDWQVLNSNFQWYTHGDDIIAAVSDEWAQKITFRDYKAAMASVGVVVTPSDKTAEDYTLAKIEDLSFIGRTFEFDDSSDRPHGMLRYTALCRMLHWTEQATSQRLCEVLASFVIELRAYPEPLYEVIRDELRTVLRKVRVSFTIPDWNTARAHLIMDRDNMAQAQALQETSDVSSLASQEHGGAVAGTSREASFSLGPRASGGEKWSTNPNMTFRISGAQPHFLQLEVHGGRGGLDDESERFANLANIMDTTLKINTTSHTEVDSMVIQAPQALHVNEAKENRNRNYNRIRERVSELNTVRKISKKCGHIQKWACATSHPERLPKRTELNYTELAEQWEELANLTGLPPFWAHTMATAVFTDTAPKLSTGVHMTPRYFFWHIESDYPELQESIKAWNRVRQPHTYGDYVRMTADPLWALLDGLWEDIVGHQLHPLDFIPYARHKARYASRLKTFDERRFRNVTDYSYADFARAGFYATSPHTVTCYACGITVGEWKTVDNPYLEHKVHSGDCPLIVAFDMVDPDVFEIPEVDQGYDGDDDVADYIQYFRAREEELVQSCRHKTPTDNPRGIRCFGTHMHIDTSGLEITPAGHVYCKGYLNTGIPRYDGFTPCRCYAMDEHQHISYLHQDRLYCNFEALRYMIESGCHGPIIYAQAQAANEHGMDLTTSMTGIGGDPMVAASMVESAQAASAGLEMAPVAPSMLSGVIPSETPTDMNAPVIPPGMETITGYTQWNTYQSIMGTEAVVDFGIINTSGEPGTLVWAAPYTNMLGKDCMKEIQRDIYFSGPIEFTIRVTSSAMTIGNVMALIFPDTASKNAAIAAAPNNLTILQRYAHVLLPLNAGTVAKTFILNDALPSGVPRVRKTTELGRTPPSSLDCPWVAVFLYDRVVNAYGTDIQVPWRVFSKPGPGFKSWGPNYAGVTPSSVAETVILPYTRHLYGQPNVFSRIEDRDSPIITKTVGYDDFTKFGQVDIPHIPTTLQLNTNKDGSYYYYTGDFILDNPENDPTDSFYNIQEEQFFDTSGIMANVFTSLKLPAKADDGSTYPPSNLNSLNLGATSMFVAGALAESDVVYSSSENLPPRPLSTRINPRIRATTASDAQTFDVGTFFLKAYNMRYLPAEPITSVWPLGAIVDGHRDPALIEFDAAWVSSNGNSDMYCRTIAGVVGMDKTYMTDTKEYDQRLAKIWFTGLNVGNQPSPPLVLTGSTIEQPYSYATPNAVFTPNPYEIYLTSNTNSRSVPPGSLEKEWVDTTLGLWVESGNSQFQPFKFDLKYGNGNLIATIGVADRKMFVSSTAFNTTLPVTGEVLMASNLREWNPVEKLDEIPQNIWQSMVIVRSDATYVRKLARQHKPKYYHPTIPVPPVVQKQKNRRKTYILVEDEHKRPAVIAQAGGMIAGGILGGLGNALGQWGQNAWWGNQFQDQWRHEKEGWQHEAAMDEARMKHEAEMAQRDREMAMQQERVDRAIKLQEQMDATGFGMSRASTRKPTIHFDDPGESSTDRESVIQKNSNLKKNDITTSASRPSVIQKNPNYRKGTDVATDFIQARNATLRRSNAFNRGINRPTITRKYASGINPNTSIEQARYGPSREGLPTFQNAPTDILGLNKIDEQFHPSIGLSSLGSIATPVMVNQAVNPYTEAQKRL